MYPKVSIIIPFYNCAYVDQAIRSALLQTYPNVEIILVDDGSFKYTEKIAPYKKHIKYIHKENGGTATALNRGLAEASGEYIAWLSSDDMFVPEKLSKQMDFMKERGLDASFTNYDIIDSNSNVQIPSNGAHYPNMKAVYEGYLYSNPINGCTILIKKSIFEKYGYFNPAMVYTHDYEMWFRLLSKGVHIEYFNESLTKFRSHAESGTRKYQQQMLAEMNVIETMYRPLIVQYIVDHYLHLQ